MIATFLSLFAAGTLPQSAPVTAPPPAPAPAPASELAPEPDIELSISAHADQVRWRQVGSISIRAWSEPTGSVIEENLSTGLPRPIPGQRTFRNIDWRLRAAATIGQPTVPAPAPAAAAPETPAPTPDDGDPQ